MRITPCLPALCAVVGGFASAQVINIDFDESSDPSSYTGLAAAPDPAGAAALWTGLSGTGTGTISASNLIDSDGESTGVAISLAINGSYLSLPGQQELGVAGAYGDLMSDYVFLSSPTTTQVLTKAGTISGLDPSKLYDIYIYGQGDNFTEEYSIGQNGLYTIGGVSKQTGWDGIAGGDGLLVEGIEYVKFSVFADPTGAIAFTYANVVSGPGGNVMVDLDGNNSRFAVINGIQIVDVGALVPEPSSALLGALGFLVMLRRRR